VVQISIKRRKDKGISRISLHGCQTMFLVVKQGHLRMKSKLFIVEKERKIQYQEDEVSIYSFYNDTSSQISCKPDIFRPITFASLYMVALIKINISHGLSKSVLFLQHVNNFGDSNRVTSEVFEIEKVDSCSRDVRIFVSFLWS
jgi:hypothetical protein